MAITDHKAITTVMSGREFETDRRNRLSAEVTEYAIHVCYRPGRLHTLVDFMSRAHIEQDPQKRQKLADELLRWRATQEAQAEKQEEQAAAAKTMKCIQADDMAGGAPVVGDNPPHLQSPAERSLQGDSQAFTEGKLQEHINRLVRGATVDMDDIDSCETAVQKVQQITRDMENGEYEADSDYSSEEEDTPRIIEMYAMACAALTWEPPAIYALPDEAAMEEAQNADKYTGHILIALTAYEQGQNQPEDDETWAQRHNMGFAIKDGILHKAWIRGKGKQATTQWQMVVPKSLQPQIIQAYHSSKRNAHYGDLKTFAQLREKYTMSWGSAFSDVRKFVLQCEICLRFGPRPSKAQRQWSLHSDIPGEHWVMDIMHMPKAQSGHEWLLTMIGICSRRAVARPIRKAEFTNEEISRMLIGEWGKVGVHIKPQKVTPDGGDGFKKCFQDMCHLLQTDRHVSIGDRPV